jgi:BirA family transcriptional regulator, biotin operon repressor / biotin---[acetyl-CoA-carboxylase] ligase
MSSLNAFQPMTPQALSMALCTSTLGRSLHILEETSSTNSAALALAQQGAADGTVVIAEAQTSGRGRLGRHWHSPRGKNLYASVLLRRAPEDLSRWLSWVPLLSAVAVARAIQVVTSLRPSLKWPNDIMLKERKVGGLLCESSGVGSAQPIVIVGIGMNVNMWRDAFPEDLRSLATSLAAEAGHPFDRASLAAMILSELELRYDAFFSGGSADIQHEYELRCSTIGQTVRADLAHGEWIEGEAASLADDGSLHILVEDSSDARKPGSVAVLRAGDVTHVRSAHAARKGN